MPAIGPIKRRDLIAYFRQLGFTGPFICRKHEFMQRDALKVRIPNPHQGDIDTKLLRDILRQAGVAEDEWLNL